MPAPEFNLPVYGSAPNQYSTENALKAAIQAIINALWDESEAKAGLPNAGKIFANRDQAVSFGQANLPNVLSRIITIEGDYIVYRSPAATADDPLFASNPRWGVVLRAPSQVLLDAVIAALEGKLNAPEGVNLVQTDEIAFGIMDALRERCIFQVGRDARTRVGSLQISDSTYVPLDDPTWAFVVQDPSGGIGAGLKKDGTFCARNFEAKDGPLIPGEGPGPGPEPIPQIIPNRIEDGVQGIYHRGYSAVAPENTIEGIIAAARAGGFVVEGDVQWTADGVPVMLHDPTIDRTSNGTGNVIDLTYDQLLTYDFSNGRAGYSNVKIPTFRQFMLTAKRLSQFCYIELKSSSWTQAQVEEILRIIGETGMRGRVELDCFSNPPLQLVVAADPAQQVGRLGSMTEGVKNFINSLKTGENVVCAAVSTSTVTEALVQEWQAEDIPVVVWTVDNVARVRELASWGVRGIMTNSLNVNQIIREDLGV